MICNACPRNCGIDRKIHTGYCGQSEDLRLGFIGKHFYEEPCISGKNGSGAFFFSGCNLRCVYCQNYQISSEGRGKIYSAQELCDEALRLKNDGAHNFNLVTATHFLPYLGQFMPFLKSLGLPVIYNCGGYESVNTLQAEADNIDVFLPDFKYFSEDAAQKYSAAADYKNIAAKAIAFMYDKVGSPVFSADGMILRGLIIRHLVLPGQKNDSLNIIDFIADNFPKAYVSIMRQYTPQFNRGGSELDRKITSYEYDCVVDRAAMRGLKGYMQARGCESAAYTPIFFD